MAGSTSCTDSARLTTPTLPAAAAASCCRTTTLAGELSGCTYSPRLVGAQGLLQAAGLLQPFCKAALREKVSGVTTATLHAMSAHTPESTLLSVGVATITPTI